MRIFFTRVRATWFKKVTWTFFMRFQSWNGANTRWRMKAKSTVRFCALAQKNARYSVLFLHGITVFCPRTVFPVFVSLPLGMCFVDYSPVLGAWRACSASSQIVFFILNNVTGETTYRALHTSWMVNTPDLLCRFIPYSPSPTALPVCLSSL